MANSINSSSSKINTKLNVNCKFLSPETIESYKNDPNFRRYYTFDDDNNIEEYFIGQPIIGNGADPNKKDFSNRTEYWYHDAVDQLAKIIYREAGADSAVNPDDNFFMRITTASAVLNNAIQKNGDNLYEQILNLTDNVYHGYSDYKNSSIDSVIPQEKIDEMRYIAELVLNGEYNLPSNMTLQASKDIVNTYGTVWGLVENQGNYYDTYFGFESGVISKEDAFGRPIEDTSIEHYKELAASLRLSDYS